MEKRTIKKILVANRGEIAVRVMRTCRDMEIPTVAVFSDPDRKSLHVRYATEAYHIGPALAKESYLNIDRIIAVAKKSGADAIHPGYGFLSENAQFAKAVSDAGLIFIGPTSESMMSMGSKTAARKLMSKAGVPVVPGLEDGVTDLSSALEYSKEIGFPVMLKASAGGGGKGMRKVERETDFSSAFRGAKSEAKNSFGDDSLYIEKFLEKPRHIEVQIIADEHGNVYPFAERECSVQRRHQKVIEESPSCFVDDNMRSEMGEIAVKAAKAVNYVGAGTIEFLVDKNRNFYFMEMNTRLQVEHPVTEMITSLDLVELQIRVARGEKIELSKNDLMPKGWAIEARVCAEDTRNNFVPSPGRVRHFRAPGGPYVRTDTAIYSGSEVTIDYDPMIAKVVAWAPTRKLAIRRLDRALAEITVKGCMTNTMFLRQILAYGEFLGGEYDTGLISRMIESPSDWFHDYHKTVALLGAALFSYESEIQLRTNVARTSSNKGNKQSISKWRSQSLFRQGPL